jgi:tRNA-dihydrouridine synthase
MYDGHADLGVIRELCESVDIRVVGNGDVCDAVSARRMFSITGCDAVMVARGALGNPWAFEQIAADLRGEPVPPPPDLEQKGRVLRRHVDLYVETFGVETTCYEIRKHLLWYFRHTPAERPLRRGLSSIEARADIDRAIDTALEACATEGRSADDARETA